MICVEINWKEALKLFRAKTGLTQEELAARLDVDRARYSHWERGRTPVPYMYQLKLSELGMNGIPSANDPRSFKRPEDDSGVIFLLIGALYDCSTPQAIRDQACASLCYKFDLSPERFLEKD